MTSLEIDFRHWKNQVRMNPTTPDFSFFWVFYIMASFIALGAFDQSQKLFASGAVFSAEVKICV